MAIPDYQTIMLPLLKFLGDEKEHSLREAIDALADQFHLTAEERRELLPSGNQEIFNNRVGWARTYMKKAGLIKSTRRGYMCITDRGLNILRQKPSKIDLELLGQFEEFIAFKTLRHEKPEREKERVKTPGEILESAYQNLRTDLANDLLQQIKLSPPSLFENIVLDLLVKMGYGGSRKDAGEAIGKTGDEGIDGIIKEDPLGLDIIYIQAKKWENTVSRPEIQKFAGALQGKHARKGIFITTSNFSREAHDFASNIETKIILIDGEQLTQLMIDHNIGVSPSVTYETKKIDVDYFTEE
jgi:restriction system protein